MELNIEIHSGRLHPCPQILDKSESDTLASYDMAIVVIALKDFIVPAQFY
jgi:hypothetical protein